MERTERLTSALLRLDAEGTLRRLSWTLRVVSGPDAGSSMELEGLLVVGSGEGADLQLSDPSVSRRHVQLEPRADGVRVQDLGSTNGTLVGGAQVREAMISHQATLSIGRTVLSVSVSDVALEAPDGPFELEGLVAQNPGMRRLFGLVQKLAGSDTPVVLLGETGTGKEGLAKAIHQLSGRRRAPFVVVDCGSIAPTLIESELFGHARGAFTGAGGERAGAFLEAEGGTLFLDELGELPLELQPKLLRALESRQIKRLGDDRYRSVDVRIVAATHRDLEAEVKAGRFRKDLYFRLAVAALRVPPLRERRDDIPLLLKSLLAQLGRESFPLSSGLESLLYSYDWPGNVRELRNVLARAVVSDEVSLHSVLNPEGAAGAPPVLPAQGDSSLALPFKEAKEKLVEGFIRDYLTALNEKHGGNVSQMARASGLARTYLHELLAKVGLRGK